MSYKKWIIKEVPFWSRKVFSSINFNTLAQFSETKMIPVNSLRIIKIYKKLSMNLVKKDTMCNLSIELIIDAESKISTLSEEVIKFGVIFKSIRSGFKKTSNLISKFFLLVVPIGNNFYAALNSSIFSDGSFCYVPIDTICKNDLLSFFRINAAHSGQFERSLIVCENKAILSYIEGCTAPKKIKNNLHAAVVELFTKNFTKINYSTIQNWYSGNIMELKAIDNLVTKKSLCIGICSIILWTQVEFGAGNTWNYPSVIFKEYSSIDFFLSISLTLSVQKTDSGSKMAHIFLKTISKIVSKSITGDKSACCYRGKTVVIVNGFSIFCCSCCDSLLLGNFATANTYPEFNSIYILSVIVHEAIITRLSSVVLFYFQQRGMAQSKVKF